MKITRRRGIGAWEPSDLNTTHEIRSHNAINQHEVWAIGSAIQGPYLMRTRSNPDHAFLIWRHRITKPKRYLPSNLHRPPPYRRSTEPHPNSLFPNSAHGGTECSWRRHGRRRGHPTRLVIQPQIETMLHVEQRTKNMWGVVSYYFSCVKDPVNAVVRQGRGDEIRWAIRTNPAIIWACHRHESIRLDLVMLTGYAP
jgi:hypothetical protein